MFTASERAIVERCQKIVREFKLRTFALAYARKYPGNRAAMLDELASALTEARDAVSFLAPLSVRTTGVRQFRG